MAGIGERGGTVNLPWYRWYTGDWLGSPTRPDMSLAERGMYRDLLDGIGGRRGT